MEEAQLPHTPVEDDPKKPYKAYAGMAAALITAILAEVTGLPAIVSVILTVVGTGLAVYSSSNPKRFKKIRPRPRRRINN